MPLQITICKRPDGSGLLRCLRADGSVTFQKQKATQAGHFIVHDLTHYAVETVLDFQVGFFGLIDLGWDIDDTTGKGDRGALPAGAILIEQIVGLYDQERSAPGGCSLEEFNSFAPEPLDQGQFDRIRKLRAELLLEWERIPIDGELVLEFKLGEGSAESE